MPFLSAEVSRDQQRILEARAQKKEGGEAVGWASGSTKFRLKFAGATVASLNLPEGEDLTCSHFFFNRNVGDLLSYFLSLSESGKIDRPQKGELIFEPGCGTGRQLYAFADRFGLRGVGADIYEPAIKVGRKADLFGDVSLKHENLISGDFLNRYGDNHFKYLLINSHLAHVLHFGDSFESYLQNLMRVSRNIFFIEDKVDGLIAAFDRHGITYDIKGKSVYGYYRK